MGIARSALPLAGVLSGDNAARYDLVGVPRVVLFQTTEPAKDPAGTRYYLNRLRKVAAEFVGQLKFVVAYTQGDQRSAYSELNFPADAKFSYPLSQLKDLNINRI